MGNVRRGKLKGIAGFVPVDVKIEIMNVKVHFFSITDIRKAPGPYEISKRGDAPAEIFSRFTDGQKPLFQRLPAVSPGITNPACLYSFAFFQAFLTLCARPVPKIKDDFALVPESP